MLVNLSIHEFLKVTAGNDPVPGGGSISALCGALSSALGEMVANLTIGKKKYQEQEELMRELAEVFSSYQNEFRQAIDEDSNAYNLVFDAFKLPKESDEEKAVRSQKIQEATRIAAEVPLQVARQALQIMEPIEILAQRGNQNAVTDACVAMMCARTAALGAILNVRINLSSLKDEEYVKQVTSEIETIEQQAILKEQQLLAWVKTII
ncbi:cyclodeaminase/cyclohydrolase family protein [Bacteroidales bacterium OttesenSCG-928-L03]|nr:cyclodeaminase/cyclohydrolase family protein [Bacteroidales bacterium OttesenSCG-928-L03]